MALKSQMGFSMRCAVGNNQLRLKLPTTSLAQQIQLLHCLSDAFESFLQEVTASDEVLPEMVEKSIEDIGRLRERVLLASFHASGGCHALGSIPEAPESQDFQEVEVQVSRASATKPAPPNDMPASLNEREVEPEPACSKDISVCDTVDEEQDADSASHASKVEQLTGQFEGQQQEVSKKDTAFCGILPESPKFEQQSTSRWTKSPSQAWSAMQAFRLPKMTSSQKRCPRKVQPDPGESGSLGD
eukprot:TRINITY_DN14890_c0_g1_i1.p1 TRINITY_DN14890_c0_g1~~TRINITY_DN14890_c0_g1_i1.p1  ORF type:complete len:244 (+),score=58.44 TRINITY_DN14890_c0_g1_i1:83-814(+)